MSARHSTKIAAPMMMAAPTIRDERVTVIVSTTGEDGFELAVVETVAETMDDSGMEDVGVTVGVAIVGDGTVGKLAVEDLGGSSSSSRRRRGETAELPYLWRRL
jgi:hypothetical protein